MEKRTCKLCFRTFANGRALGGHMRSHLALAKPDRQRRASLPPPPPPPSPSPTPSASSTSSHEAAEGYVLRENPRRSFRLVDPEFSSTLPALDAGSSSVVQDGESETESPRAAPGVRRLRSGRRRRAAPDQEPASSVSDATTEEDVALSLMMLSRDAWAIAAAAGADDDEESEESESEEQRVVPAAATRQQGKGGRSRHQCGTCRKVFRSYQALGGHRASHKRSNGCVPVANADPEADKSHECPVCFRVFPSGQALGGHKRSHLAALGATAAAPPAPTMTVSCSSPAAPKLGESFIDLNLPAPVDDDFELSAVSDAGFAAFRPT